MPPHRPTASALLSTSCWNEIWSTSNLVGVLSGTQVTLPRHDLWVERLIEAAGWLGSLLIAVIATTHHCASMAIAIGTWWAALDAVTSDLLGVGGEPEERRSGTRSYRCGNFGLMLLSSEHRDKIAGILRTMIQVVRRSTATPQPTPLSQSTKSCQAPLLQHRFSTASTVPLPVSL